MVRYRLIHSKKENDPCVWQAQERVFFFFWLNICGPSSSPKLACEEIIRKIKQDQLLNEFK